jgi:hypothetical protein
VLSRVVRLVRAPRRMGQQLKPAAAAAAPPVAVGAALASRSRRTVAS